MQVSWDVGIFLGKTFESDVPLIGTRHGVMEARSIKRFPEDQRWQVDVLNEMIGLPWDRKGKTQGGGLSSSPATLQNEKAGQYKRVSPSVETGIWSR